MSYPGDKLGDVRRIREFADSLDLTPAQRRMADKLFLSLHQQCRLMRATLRVMGTDADVYAATKAAAAILLKAHEVYDATRGEPWGRRAAGGG